MGSTLRGWMLLFPEDKVINENPRARHRVPPYEPLVRKLQIGEVKCRCCEDTLYACMKFSKSKLKERKN